MRPGGRAWPGLRRRHGPGASGLTLLEVLIAAAILGVALLGMAGAFPSAFLQVSAGGRMTKAAGLAHQMMEAVRAEPSFFIPRYAGNDGLGVSTDAPANFPADWPWPCASGWTWGEQFCGGTKLARWQQDLAADAGDGLALARVRGTVTVTDHENPAPGGGGASSAATTMLRVTVTVNWDDQAGRRQVTLTATVPCLRPGCN